jgi:hypothetical protein
MKKLSLVLGMLIVMLMLTGCGHKAPTIINECPIDITFAPCNDSLVIGVVANLTNQDINCLIYQSYPLGTEYELFLFANEEKIVYLIIPVDEDNPLDENNTIELFVYINYGDGWEYYNCYFYITQ